MRFYELTHPEYATDHDADSRNPVISIATYHIPGILCDVCGQWSSSNRVRVEPRSNVEEFEGMRFLPAEDWRRRRDTWARILNTDVESIVPGATLGPPMGVCTSAICEDAVHPMPGEVWVGTRARGVLVAAKFTGVSYTRVQLTSECGEVDLWELVVHGRAWRTGSTPESLQLCSTCGRSGFPSPMNMSVDEARWDGSDFVILDGNPNIIIVTERVRDTLKANHLTNLVAIPID